MASDFLKKRAKRYADEDEQEQEQESTLYGGTDFLSTTGKASSFLRNRATSRAAALDEAEARGTFAPQQESGLTLPTAGYTPQLPSRAESSGQSAALGPYTLTPAAQAEFQRRASGMSTAPNAAQTAEIAQVNKENAERAERAASVPSGWRYVADTLDSGAKAFGANMTQGLSALDKLDYWLAVKTGGTFGGFKADTPQAYEAAHALDADIQNSVAAAKEGKGKWASRIIDAFGAAGNIFGSSAMAYGATGMGALSSALSPVASRLSSASAGLGASVGQKAAAAGSRLAGNLIGDLATSTTNLAISAQSGINTFDTAKSYGADDRTAAAAGLAAGMTEYISNKMFSGTPLEDNPGEKGYVVELMEDIADRLARKGKFGQTLETLMGRFFSTPAIQFVFDKSGEGMEEVITGIADPLIARLTYNKNEDLATFDSLLEEYIGGVLMSLVVGAPQTAINATRGAVYGIRGETPAAPPVPAAAAQGNTETAATPPVPQGAAQGAQNVNRAQSPGLVLPAVESAPAIVAAQENAQRATESTEQARDIRAELRQRIEARPTPAEVRGWYTDSAIVSELQEAGLLTQQEAENNDVSAMWTAAENYVEREEQNGQERTEREQNGQRPQIADLGDQQAASAEQLQYDGWGRSRTGGGSWRQNRVGSGGQSFSQRVQQLRQTWQRQKDAGRIRGALAALGDVERVSTASQGIENGTDRATVYVIPDVMDAKTEKALAPFREVQRIFAQRGINVRGFTGTLEMQDDDGNVFRARGAVSGDGKTIWVRLDHSDLGWQQILGHEDFHERVKNDKALLRDVAEAFDRDFSEDERKAIVNDYFDTYGYYNVSEDYVLEEVLADYYAGIDIYAGTENAQRDITERSRNVQRSVGSRGEARSDAANAEVKTSRETDILESEINGAGLVLTSRDNNKNNRRIQAWLKENHPELVDRVLFFNDKNTGTVRIESIEQQTNEEKNRERQKKERAQREETEKINSEYGLTHENALQDGGLIRGWEDRDAVALALENALQKMPEIEDVDVYKSRGMGSYETMYIRADLSNGERVEYRLSGHDSRLGGADRYFWNDNYQNVEQLLDDVKAAIREEFTEGNTASEKTRTSREDALVTNRDEVLDYSGMTNQEAGAQANEVVFSRETDPETLDFLNNQDTVTVYRAMQVMWGRLYPPMAAKVRGEDGKRHWVEPTEYGRWYRSDEHPELVDENGKFLLDKGDGTSLKAAYNPYFHTSNSPLNDQFTSAYRRKNLVIVECSIPKSELTSGYRAEGAKDTVGEMNWHSGPVSSKLKGDKARRVTLSRWVRVERIVPEAEAAQKIAELLDGTGLEIPANTVTPALREELEKQGVKIGATRGTVKASRESGERFSMEKPVEETRDLIAVHNLTERNLIDMGELGGAPAPSIAIVKAEAGHTKYGPISLVYNKDSIDPKKDSRNRVYGSDAWTPTAPSIGYQLNEKGAKAMRRRIDDILGDERSLVSVHIDDDNLSDKLNRNNGDFVQSYRNESGMKYAFLKDTGRAERMPTRERRYSQTVSNDALRELAKRYDLQEVFGSGYDGTMALEPELREWLREKYTEEQLRKGADPETVARVANAIYGKEQGYNKLNSLFYAALQLQNAEDTTEADSSVLDDLIRKAFTEDGTEAEYENWLAELGADLIAKRGIRNQRDFYTSSGNRRSFDALYDPYTLENIVKAMARDTQRGTGAFGVGAGLLQSVTTPSYKSIREIKADSGRLMAVGEEEFDKLKKDLDDRIMEAVETVYGKTKHWDDNRFIEFDNIAQAVINAARGNLSEDSIMRSMRKDGYPINADIAVELRSIYQDSAQLPTEYFEAKPMRAVGFEEIVAAVVPDDISDKARKVLTDNGVNTVEYESGNDGDRIAKLNGLEGVKFSRETDAAYLAAVEAGDMETAQRMVDEAAKRAGYTVKAWHQTANDFTVFNTNNPGAALNEKQDIRYSRDIPGETEELRAENEALKERLAYWQSQVKPSDRTQPREEDVRRVARDLLNTYGSTADLEATTEALRELAHTTMSDDVRWTDVRDQATRLAGSILQNAKRMVEGTELNREIRADIRGKKISFTEQGNIPDYNQWRKNNFGKLTISKDGTPVDVRWQELQDKYGEGYFPANITSPTDQIIYLADMWDRLRDAYENPYSADLAEATQYVANEIIDRVIGDEIRQAPTTFADRKERQIAREALKGEIRVEKVKALLEAERERRKAQVAELKEHYRDKEAKGRESRKAQSLRTKITKHARKMTEELLHPTDKRHIPDSLRRGVAAMLSAIDLGSGYSIVYDRDGNYKRVERGLELGAEETRRTQAFLAVRAALLKEADGLVMDPTLLGTTEEPGNLTRLVTDLANTPIASMNSEELQVVYDALRGVEAAVRSANQMLSQARWGAVSEAADALRSDNAGKAAPPELAGYPGRVQGLTRLDMLTPEGYFHRLGKAGQAVFKMLRGAQDAFITNMADATEDTRKIIGDMNTGALEREQHKVTMGGEEVTMTTAQIMELYCLMQRDQGMQHIMTGGILIEPVRKGVKKTTQTEPLHPSLGELADAVNLLTADEIRVADALQKYLSVDMAELGNEATLAVYGYKKFGQEEKYWKIRSNRNELQQSIEKETQTTSVANRGFTKAVNPRADTSVKIGSIFDTYSQSINDMATYAAWLAVGEDVNRIRNYAWRDADGQRAGTVKGILDRVHGTGGANYLQRLLADIANGAGTDDTGLTSGFVGAYKAAAIGANIRVIIQQPTAILRAAEMIDPKYLAIGLKAPMKSFETAKKYSPIAQWKDWGYFDINTGRKMKDVLFENSSKLEKLRQVSMSMAGKADSFAWGQLWGAVEAETKDKTNLAPGTNAFYNACAKRFNEIIDHTQVVDGILQRSQIMRSKDAITRMAVSFMSEPTKQYNQFMNAVYDLRHTNSPAEKKEAKQQMARTVFSMLAAGLANVLAQSIVDALRDDDREKKYWEKLLQKFLGYNPDDDTFGEKFKTFAFSNMGELVNPASYLPYAKDIMSIIQGYSVDRMDMDAISDTVTAMTRVYKALNGEGKQTAGYSLVKLTEQASKLLGLPLYNIDRDLTSLITTVANDAEMPVLQYYLNRYRYKPLDSGNLSAELKGILWDARQKDDGSYDIIVGHLLNDGYAQDIIDKAMQARFSQESGFTDARKAADAAGNNNGSYDLNETLTAFKSLNLTESEREALLMAELSDSQYIKYSVLKSYLDFDTWLSVMLKMPDSTPTQKEIEAVLDAEKNLTTKQKAALWQAISGSEVAKNNPYDKGVGQKIIDAVGKAKGENEPKSTKSGGGGVTGASAPVKLPTLRLPTANDIQHSRSGLVLPKE